MSKLIDVSEASQIMGLSKKEVRVFCRTGSLPGAKQKYVNGPWEIPIKAVEKWIITSDAATKEQKKKIRTKIIKTYISYIFVVVFPLIIALLTFVSDWGGVRSQFIEWGVWKNFSPQSSNETLIVIQAFYRTEGVIDTDIQGEIQRAIQETAKELDYENIRVEIEPRALRSDDHEKIVKIATQYDASIIIWGEDTGTRVTVNVFNTRFSTKFLHYKFDESHRTQIANPQAYAKFVTKDLPGRLSFLSFYTLSHSSIASNKYSDAIELMETAVHIAEERQLQDAMYYSYYYMGALYTLMQKTEMADHVFQKALSINPEKVDAYTKNGMVRMQSGDFDGAIDDFRKAVKIDPDNELTYLNLGFAYYVNQELDQAILEYNKAIALNSEFVLALINRGNIYHIQGDTTAALEDYNTAISISPSIDAYYNRAIVFENDLHSTDQALADIKKILDEDPSYLSAYSLRAAILLRNGDFEGAIKDYTSIINAFKKDQSGFDFQLNLGPRIEYSDNPESISKAYFSRGYIYYRRGDYKSAIDDFTQAIENYDVFTIEDCDMYENVIPCSENFESITFYDHVLSMIYGYRGMAKRKNNDKTGAVSDHTKAINYYPSEPKHYNNRGNVLRELALFEQALADLNKAIELDSEVGDFYINRAIILYDLKEYDRAISDCQTAIKLTSENPEIYYWKGKAFVQLEDYTNAIANFEKYLELRPNAFDRHEIENLIIELKQES